ncbi:MAG: hypothetical protein J1E83_10640 [Lachnospiraceae bacterium]|nr:hypothetical protein [Lachnospiraceae bacterium]
MGTLEIVLLIIGAVIFVLSFLLPAGTAEANGATKEMVRDEVKNAVSKEMDGVKGQIEDIVDETVTYAVEKTERALERVSNEKIMAVNEYSDTVLEDINKNHKEVMFLYDMLNDKHENIKNAVSKMEQTVKEAEQSAREAAKEVEAAAAEAVSSMGTASPMGVASPIGALPPTGAVSSTATASLSGLDRLTGAVSAIESDLPAEESKSAKTGKKRKKEEPEAEVIALPQPEAPNGFQTLSPQKISEKEVSRKVIRSITPDLDISFTQEDGKNGNSNNNEKILRLHNEGKSNIAIAKELGLGVGEVKLVIDLFEGV